MQTFLVWIAFAAALSTDVAVAQVQFQSGPKQVSLLELYTSEGCSSCPPAESWLSRLKAAPGLWSDFVPLAFHVDYWDYLGWRDKWAARQFSDRQRAYAQCWGRDNIYTPGLVLDGKEWRSWSGRTAVPVNGGAKPGVLKVTSEDTNHWQVGFAPVKPEATSYEVHVVLLVSGLVSDVKAGENTGRHLNHDFVVLTLLKRTLTRQQDNFRGMFTMDTELRPNEGRLALAVWITQTGQMEPVQAAGGWLTALNRN
jgi:hypothetical protein